MSKKYQKVVAVGPYKAEIYDGCFARLESNGRRFRVRVDGTHWQGNTGGFHEYRTYLERSEGRALLRRYRQAVIDQARGRYERATPLDILSDAIGR